MQQPEFRDEMRWDKMSRLVSRRLPVSIGCCIRTRTNVFCPDLRVLILIEDIDRSLNLWPVMPSIEHIPINTNRRRLLRWISSFSVFLLKPVIAARKPDANRGLGSVSDLEFRDVLEGLMGKSPKINDQGLRLEIPSVAENGALVPVALSASVATESLYILAQGNPGPLLAEFHFYGSAVPKVSLRVKLNQTGPVTALSRNQGGWMRIDHQVKVAVGGCG